MSIGDDEPATPATARKQALGWLARRPLTGREIRRRLEEKGCSASVIDEVLQGLRGDGCVDDAALAEHFIATRLTRERHGPRRLIRDLIARGVEPEVARRAWETAIERYGLDPQAVLEERIRRQLATRPGPLDSRAYRRVYNALLRAGFPAEQIARTLRPHVVVGDLPGREPDSREE